MKTQHILNKIRGIKGVAAVVIAFTFIFVGCGGDDGTSRTRAGGRSGDIIRDPGCDGCPSSGLRIGEALGFSYIDHSRIRFQLSLDLFGDTAVLQGSTSNYSGPVFADYGEFIVDFEDFLTCPIPRGRYTIRTLNPGQFDSFSGVFSGLVLEAVSGGNVVRIEIENGALENAQPSIYGIDDRQYSYILNAYVRILQYNEMPCNGDYDHYFIGFM